MTSVQEMTTRILLVEDNPDHAALLRALLRQGDANAFGLARVDRLEGAIDHLLHQEVDIILLDLYLPDASGLEALERVHGLVPALPIVILTDLTDEAAAFRALHCGAQDYLIKNGLDGATLQRAIRYAIERNRVIRELDTVTNRLRSANLRLERMALLDPLTEVLNRRGLQQVFSRELRWSRRTGAPLMALLLDLDDFKQINDTMGHVAGDVVLKAVAHELRNCIRATDYVARIGGDEFLILLPGTAPEDGWRIAEKVRLTVSATPLSMPSGVIRVTASLGVLPIPGVTDSLDEVLGRIHFVLAASKQGGKNCVTFPEKAQGEPLRDVLQILLEGDALRVAQEPIVRLSDEQPVGYEFLSRLLAGVFTAPDDFFRVSREANVLTLVDYRCFKNCLAAAAPLPSWVRRHLNLFPSTLLNLPIHNLLESLPDESVRSSYCVEISEQQIIGDPLDLTEPVQALRQTGVRIAIDDVGFGHSCLESLVFLEPDILKIDRRCIGGIAHNPGRLRRLKRLLSLASALGAEVVAEGIESREDLDVLKYLGVPYGQGFLWANASQDPR